MKSKTSFFDLTVLKKDITRFAPLWVLYCIALAVALLVCNTADGARDIATGLTVASELMFAVNLLYAGIAAMTLFGDLYKSRLCNALHAMPMRREGWFLTHFVSGLLFSVVPTTAAMLILLPMLGEFSAAAVAWWGVTCLEYLFCFGVASFAALCTGNRLGFCVIYGFIQFGSQLLELFLSLIYEPLLFGVKLDYSVLELLCPAVHIAAEPVFCFGIAKNGDLEGFTYTTGAWQYLTAAAAVGLAFAALALLLYRIRKMESAGDFIAFAPLKPVFLLAYTLCCGMFLRSVTCLFADETSYVFFAIGIAVGFFTGLMLLERTAKVFRKKSFIVFAIGAAVLAATMIFTCTDPAGLVNYVPRNPVSVTVAVNNDNGYTTSDAAEIAQLQQAHEFLLEEHSSYGSEVALSYKLRSGATVKRYYYVDTDSKAYDILEKFANTYQCILGADDWNVFTAGIQEIYAYSSGENDFDYQLLTVSANRNMLDKLTDALKADFDQGHIYNDFTYSSTRTEFCTLEIDTSDDGYHLISITDDAVHTVAVVREMVDSGLYGGEDIGISPNEILAQEVENTVENS